MLNCNSTGQEGGGPESSALIVEHDRERERDKGPPESCEEEYDYNHL